MPRRSLSISRYYAIAATTAAKSAFTGTLDERYELARSHFITFRELVCSHATFPHQKTWIDLLNTGVDNRYLRGVGGEDTLILAPRNSAKSTLLIEWVAWVIGIHTAPEHQIPFKVLYVSYEVSTAQQKSQQVQRILESTEYRKVFPWVRPGSNWAKGQWEIDFSFAGIGGVVEPYTLVSAGLKGAATGKRCLVGDTLIETEIGFIPISEFTNHIGIKVKTFDEKTNSIQWRRVTAIEGRPANELYEIRTSGGRLLRCTSNHPLYIVGQGYQQTQYLLPGDTIIVTPQLTRTTQKLFGMSKRIGQKEQWSPLSKMLRFDSLFRIQNSLQNLSKNIFNEALRFKKEGKQRNKKPILLAFLSWSQQFNSQILFKMWSQNIRFLKKEIRQFMSRLFGDRQTGKKNKTRCCLSNLSNFILSKTSITSVLFENLCKQSSFREDERVGEQPSYKRKFLQQTIFRYTPANFSQRQLSMSGLWNGREHRNERKVGVYVQSSGTSYQSRPNRQPHREFDNRVSRMSYDTSSKFDEWETDTISSITRTSCTTDELVYDIEVEGTHNFFANEVLVHNSNLIVLDDLIKSPEMIANPKIREQMETTWKVAIAPVRFDGTRAICLGTRMTANDIYCTTFTPYKGWKVIEQSAILKDSDGNEYSYWEPESPTAPGMPLVTLQKYREDAPIAFSYQYQNKVVSLSTLGISLDWIQYDYLPDKFERLVIGIDLSAGDRETNDYTCFVLSGMAKVDDKYRFYIIDLWRDRIMGNVEKLDALANFYENWKHLSPYFEVIVESNAYQLSFAGDFQTHLIDEKGLYNLAVSPTPSKGSKLTRLRGVTGLFQNGLVKFNYYGNNLSILVTELTEFGSTSHDDACDACVLALTGLRDRHPLSAISTERDEELSDIPYFYA